MTKEEFFQRLASWKKIFRELGEMAHENLIEAEEVKRFLAKKEKARNIRAVVLIIAGSVLFTVLINRLCNWLVSLLIQSAFNIPAG